MSLFWADDDLNVGLYLGDCVEEMNEMPRQSIDVIFADPPYFLSRKDGTTCQSGQRVSVEKGDWDHKRGAGSTHQFNGRWLNAARRVLKRTGTIWVTGTSHNIHSVAMAMAQLDYRLINEVTWQKPNPPPNLGCRCLTHSHETLLWASRNADVRYHFDYETMKSENGGKQMKDVWRGTPPPKAERTGHKTQKPLWLVRRCLLASVPPGGHVLDPFNGSGTTAMAVVEAGNDWAYTGIDNDEKWLGVTRKRLER